MQPLLGYGCWEPIFKHLDINQRLQLSNRCPALKLLHKRLPWKIDYLQLEGTPPKWVLDENKRGGAHYDVEQYGRPRDPTPEDIENIKDKMVQRKENIRINPQIAWLKKAMAADRQLLALSKAKYSHYLQITRVSQGVARIQGIAVYDRQIHHAEDYLIGTLFKNAVGIDKVVISEESRFFNKFGYDHPLIKSTKFLEISSPLARTIGNVKNNRVLVREVQAIEDFAEELIEAWLGRKPSIGTHFTARVGDKTEGVAAMITIGNNPLSYCYIIPLTEITDIVVYCEFLEINKFLRTRPYNLHFVVHPKGYAGPLSSNA